MYVNTGHIHIISTNPYKLLIIKQYVQVFCKIHICLKVSTVVIKVQNIWIFTNSSSKDIKLYIFQFSDIQFSSGKGMVYTGEKKQHRYCVSFQ